MPKRNRELNLFGVFCVAEKATIGAANASPVSTAAGIARRISGEVAAPNTMMTSVKTLAISTSRAPIQARLPSAMSRPSIGVAYIAWKTRDPDEPGHDRERRLERGRLHARRGEETRSEERQVRDAAERGVGRSVHIGTEAEAHRGEEQHGRQERAEDARPERPPVTEEAVLEDPCAGPASPRQARSSVDQRAAGQTQEHVLER